MHEVLGIPQKWEVLLRELSYLFALLRVRQRVAVPRAEVAREAAELRDELLTLEDSGKIVVGPGLRGRLHAQRR